jgi:hypothetical protein
LYGIRRIQFTTAARRSTKDTKIEKEEGVIPAPSSPLSIVSFVALCASVVKDPD